MLLVDICSSGNVRFLWWVINIGGSTLAKVSKIVDRCYDKQMDTGKSRCVCCLYAGCRKDIVGLNNWANGSCGST